MITVKIQDKKILEITDATMTVSSTAKPLSSSDPSMPAGTTGAIITVETDQVRWYGNKTPTTTTGHLMNIGDSLDFTDKDWANLLSNIQFIRVTADATLTITYLRLV